MIAKHENCQKMLIFQKYLVSQRKTNIQTFYHDISMAVRICSALRMYFNGREWKNEVIGETVQFGSKIFLTFYFFFFIWECMLFQSASYIFLFHSVFWNENGSSGRDREKRRKRKVKMYHCSANEENGSGLKGRVQKYIYIYIHVHSWTRGSLIQFDNVPLTRSRSADSSPPTKINIHIETIEQNGV